MNTSRIIISSGIILGGIVLLMLIVIHPKKVTEVVPYSAPISNQVVVHNPEIKQTDVVELSQAPQDKLSKVAQSIVGVWEVSYADLLENPNAGRATMTFFSNGTLLAKESERSNTGFWNLYEPPQGGPSFPLFPKDTVYGKLVIEYAAQDPNEIYVRFFDITENGFKIQGFDPEYEDEDGFTFVLKRANLEEK